MKRKTGRVSLDKLIHCLTKINHFGMYWEKSPSFTDWEIRSYFSEENLHEKNIYSFLMERDLMRSGKLKKDIKYIGEKTPLNIFHIRKILKWFPDALVLFIYRNPIDVLRSEVNKKRKPDYFLTKNNPLYPYGLVAFVFFEWLLATLIALYNNNVNKNNFFVVSYEQLSSHQKESILKICSTIDIDYNESLCVFKKIASSYQGGKGESFWYPPMFVSLIYRFLLNPLSVLLDRKALNAEHVLAPKRH
jgi:sulfotransferase family protein